ncbi:MAG TPA: F0F1 ATP synthase subunit B [Vicinamibacterales bacterium]|nr:F0F1 ATP synthase subunit B [Vicinamibacterales bacterium]
MDINFTLFAQAIAFALLVLLIAKMGWGPLQLAIEERQKTIADGLAAAERSQKDLAQAQDKVADELKHARAKANEIIAQAEARAAQIVDAAKQEAIAEGMRQKALAESEIEASAFRAKEALRREVGAIAVAGAEKLIGREIDAKVHASLIDELAAQI